MESVVDATTTICLELAVVLIGPEVGSRREGRFGDSENGSGHMSTLVDGAGPVLNANPTPGQGIVECRYITGGIDRRDVRSAPSVDRDSVVDDDSGSFQPLDIRMGSNTCEDHVRLNDCAVAQMHPVTIRCFVDGDNRMAADHADSVFHMEVSHHLGDLRSDIAVQGEVLKPDRSDIKSCLPEGGGYFEANEPGADDDSAGCRLCLFAHTTAVHARTYMRYWTALGGVQTTGTTTGGDYESSEPHLPLRGVHQLSCGVNRECR